ncbi:MAPEG family protein [Hyphobacterium sp. CCMP332]|uniref:MAPEG family protein n=1 Tax=Hyphobacterium sp. CCMP332 TaxID=2749086 RepID=UPI0016501C5C|nr:MAPEG family protein [Hyphobacterium sp. CCMP332]QNL19819.1 MAPEG family protein [Hyphobacterium sp. CCMP332]
MPSILHAAAALALLTLFVYFLMTVLGVIANARGELSKEYSLTKTGAPPPAYVGNAGRNLVNLLELPVLFYVLIALHLAADIEVWSLQLTLAWVFVGLRYLHTLIHITINIIGLRFLVHRISAVVLAAMWLHFLLAL